ncbi:MAG: hypothetical protein PHU12_00985 [Candidatus Aenigmarchaeota archaeon]|nr:hypothetical protein [Candidatus Aenigmarchaeota archaeon]
MTWDDFVKNVMKIRREHDLYDAERILGIHNLPIGGSEKPPEYHPVATKEEMDEWRRKAFGSSYSPI